MSDSDASIRFTEEGMISKVYRHNEFESKAIIKEDLVIEGGDSFKVDFINEEVVENPEKEYCDCEHCEGH